MPSGIYLLKFNDSNLYIGKSNNIERRWNEHTTKFQKGSAAKAMQNAYDCYGPPKFIILLECHEDHIDLMESIYIKNNWHRGLLNTTQPSEVSLEDEEVLRDNENLLEHSTSTHIKIILNLINEKDIIENKYTKLLHEDKNDRIRILENDKETLEHTNDILRNEITRIKSMSFLDRLFGF